MRRILTIALLVSAALVILLPAPLPGDNSLSVPEPPKADVLFLVLADNLVELDTLEAQQDVTDKGKKNQEMLYSIAGEHAKATTPLASPVFAVKRKELDLDKLQLFPFEILNGRRQIIFSRKKQPHQYWMTAKKSGDSEDICRLEVNESLPVGEYGISPSGTNQVFAFAVD